MGYPSWRYRTGEARIVRTAEEDAALGPGWVDSPALVMVDGPLVVQTGPIPIIPIDPPIVNPPPPTAVKWKKFKGHA